jgi:hypothetical protein
MTIRDDRSAFEHAHTVTTREPGADCELTKDVELPQEAPLRSPAHDRRRIVLLLVGTVRFLFFQRGRLERVLARSFCTGGVSEGEDERGREGSRRLFAE